uniref:Uncharacterized protein n=1 Tax=Myoviridae sp. cthAo37 TaxID=2827701 RepID=A0A8S5S532_9CAUD|nr:MAG TPA: hypothetical protein [Myoviridae sp. cthAo37]DAW03870.1 MAG TPA: hypothetical protein [Caudoviricetes sp.]
MMLNEIKEYFSDKQREALPLIITEAATLPSNYRTFLLGYTSGMADAARLEVMRQAKREAK